MIKFGLILDVETTGVNLAAEIVEIAIADLVTGVVLFNRRNFVDRVVMCSSSDLI